MTLANHCSFFMPLLKNSIMATYGHPRMEEDVFIRKHAAGELSQQQIDDQECPGPYSFYGYLMALLRDGFWGDEIVLTIVSMMFQCGITVLNANNFLQTKIWHNTPLKDADIILVHCQGRHYVPVCKYNLFRLLHPDGYKYCPTVKYCIPTIRIGILMIQFKTHLICICSNLCADGSVLCPDGCI